MFDKKVVSKKVFSILLAVTFLLTGAFPAKAETNPSAQALITGTPGLSFRYVQSFGTANTPYVVDTTHLNGPNGLFIDAADTLFVTEESGSRVLAYNAAGVNTMALGHAGQPWGHDDFLSLPLDIAKDAAGNIWIVFNNAALKEFDSTGATVMQSYPATNNWETGSDNGHFNGPRGIAFNTAGLMFVSDANNHRIQIYDVSGASPAYQGTIGVTESSQSDNTGFNQPGQIAFDSLGRLYVMDTANYRIQRCTSTAPWTVWACSVFLGETGVAGNDITHIDWSYGIGIDSSDNIFVADGSNFRILKCDTSGTCTHFAGTNGVRGTDNAHFWWTSDVDVDSSGNVYVSDFNNYRIQKFNSAGLYQSSIGTPGVPYQTDAAHINSPWGIALAADGGFYVTESAGYRLIKMDKNGAQQWTIGSVGSFGNDNAHFGDVWGGPKGTPAVDAAGNVYVTDTHNDRVQIFTSSGAYVATLGSLGTGNYQFAGPIGADISPINGDLYIVDSSNHRIQVFTSGQVYKATLGETGVTGTSNTRFNYPTGVAIDASGNIFVADHDNHRVQKCILIAGAPGFSCTTFAGVSGVSGTDYEHLGGPIFVEVDSAGRVYVVEEWNSRVQVFDASGAYLTTISGNWGTVSGDMINPSGLALDGSGNVYVTDRDNHRIQEFALGTPNWVQSNINGFGNQANSNILSMTIFNNQLYAGIQNDITGAQLWRSSDGVTWSSAMTNGFGNATNLGIDDLLVFNNQLYAGVVNWNIATNLTTGGQLWRSSDGTTWSQLTLPGFAPLTNLDFFQLASYNGKIYASTWPDGGTHGGEIWRSSTGNSNDWAQIESNGFGDLNNVATAFTDYNSNFYAGTWNTTSGAEVWRSPSGDAGTWTQVNIDGFGDPGNNSVSAFATFGSYLYASTGHDDTGEAEVWRCQICNGSDWTQVVDNTLTNVDTRVSPALEISNGKLYLIAGNYTTGLEIWRTINGTTWEQVTSEGFGTKNNSRSNWDNSVTTFGGRLYVGTLNWVNGGQIWHDTIDDTAPTVSITRASLNPTTAASVNFTVTFSEPVTGVSQADFSLTPGGITGASITSINGSGATYTVAVGTGTGSGTLRLDIPNTATITDISGNAVSSLPYTSGQAYNIRTAVFTDVATSYWAWQYIERLANAGITGGCGTGVYCPDNSVTRAQMAIFLLKGIHGSSYAPPAVGGSTGFGDVATNYWAAAWIKQLAAEGITGGCGGGNYCPDNTVTRAQMAVFLMKAKNGSSYSPPAVGGNTGFSDVATDYWAAAFIKQLVADAITAGCGNGNYCPEDSVTRAQMAVFLVKAFNLP